ERVRADRRRRLRRRRVGSARDRAAPRAPTRADRRLHRADLGGEPRLADRRHRGTVHRVPGSVQHAWHRAAHSISIMLIGIVLRGSAFVFRAYGTRDRSRGRWGAAFAAASIVTPLLLGIIIGAIVNGAVADA